MDLKELCKEIVLNGELTKDILDKWKYSLRNGIPKELIGGVTEGDIMKLPFYESCFVMAQYDYLKCSGIPSNDTSRVSKDLYCPMEKNKDYILWEDELGEKVARDMYQQGIESSNKYCKARGVIFITK